MLDLEVNGEFWDSHPHPSNFINFETIFDKKCYQIIGWRPLLGNPGSVNGIQYKIGKKSCFVTPALTLDAG